MPPPPTSFRPASSLILRPSVKPAPPLLPRPDSWASVRRRRLPPLASTPTTAALTPRCLPLAAQRQQRPPLCSRYQTPALLISMITGRHPPRSLHSVATPFCLHLPR